MKFLTTHTLKTRRGFTLLLAALIASIAIALGAAIFDIAQKQVVLSSTAKQSQFAFYAADTAAECALYWDIRYNYFGTTTPSVSLLPNSNPPSCDGQSIALATPLNNQQYNQNCTTNSQGHPVCSYVLSSPTEIPQINLFTTVPNATADCAQIVITKTYDFVTNTTQTFIQANGFNVPCGAISSSNLALERSVQLNY